MENQDIEETKGLVSVIVPCYNYGYYLPFTLDSIRNQTYQHWECIIVDDGSTDHTAQVAQEYTNKDYRFKYVYQHNQGLSAARNTGIRKSKGEFLQFLDSDDLIESRKLEQQVKILNFQLEVDIVFVDVKLFSDDTVEVYFDTTFALQKSGAGEEIVRTMLSGQVVVVNSPLIRAGVIKDVGYFDKSLITSEDYDFWLRCALKNKSFYYLKDEKVQALVRKGHQSMSRNMFRMLLGSLNMLKGLEKYTESNPFLTLLLLDKQKTIKDLYGTQMYKAAVYVDFGSNIAQLLKAFCATKDLFFVKLVGKAVCVTLLRSLLTILGKYRGEGVPDVR